MLRIAESRMRRRELRDEEDGRTVVPGGPREIQPRRPHRHGVSASSYPDSGNQFDMSDCTQRPRSYAPSRGTSQPRTSRQSYRRWICPQMPPERISTALALRLLDLRGLATPHPSRISTLRRRGSRRLRSWNPSCREPHSDAKQDELDADADGHEPATSERNKALGEAAPKASI
ncbi:hypothetical protein FA13DRAFT_1290843 [Coprinellus micaceus]|uniref:Uncharacterized protein n=1 Tax=Coprinellus micaceus TaxID=71717 RepID=A0A4Y7R686_COPMI|nr:hypothetical protein FA13DRAFT_1290843 [Coprinellus micaceus]